METVRGLGYRLVPPPRARPRRVPPRRRPPTGDPPTLPHSLTGQRSSCAFVPALGARGLLLAVSASLFVVLRDAPPGRDQGVPRQPGRRSSRLPCCATSRPESARASRAGRSATTRVRSSTTAASSSSRVRTGAIRIVVGNPSSDGRCRRPRRARPPTRSARCETSDGKQYIYIEPNASGTARLHVRLRRAGPFGRSRPWTTCSRTLIIVVVLSCCSWACRSPGSCRAR